MKRRDVVFSHSSVVSPELPELLSPMLSELPCCLVLPDITARDEISLQNGDVLDRTSGNCDIDVPIKINPVLCKAKSFDLRKTISTMSRKSMSGV